MQDLLKKLLFGNAGGSNGGAPSLNLSFVDGGTFSPRITFSRGTNATLTDSNGLIAWAPHNLLTNSEDFEAAAWTKNAVTIASNNTVAPDSTITADRMSENAVADAFACSVTGLSFTTANTFSIYAKANGRRYVFLRLFSSVGNYGNVTFDLQTGLVTQTNSVGTVTVVGSITSVGNGWYRLSSTASSSSGAITIGGILLSDTATPTFSTAGVLATPYIGDGSSGIFIWGAQLNVGALQTYNSTTPKNLLGFTQEPENAAWTKSNSYVQQNLLTWSQDFSNAAWTKDLNRGSFATNAISPIGDLTAQTLTAGTDGYGYAYRNAFPTTISTVYAYSFYAKAGASNFAWFEMCGAGASYVNLTTLATTPAAGVTVTATSAGSGWVRITGVATASATSHTFSLGGSNASGSIVMTSGNTVILWGAQLVQGADAGQYTQTTSAAAVTRYMAWDGTLTGRKLVDNTVGNTHQVFVATTYITNGIYGWSIYAKAAELNWVWVNAHDGSDRRTFFNLSNGTVGTNAAGNTATITSVGGGWYRCSVIRSAATTSGYFAFGVAQADNTPSYTGDGTSGIYVTDFQLSNSASVDPYVYNPQAAAASAAFYGPRIDYDPVTLASRGLLIEEQRTNLLTYSEDFTNAAWNKASGAAATPNTAVAPDGTTTADTLTTSAAGSYIGQTLTVNGSHVFSVYLKRLDNDWVFVGNNNSIDKVVWFNLSTGVRGTQLNATGEIQPVGNGWYRCSVIHTATNVSSSILNVVSVAADNSNVRQGSFFAWGAQLEAGAFATSYTPTVASQVTRNADSASMLGDNFYTWFNVNQGSWNVVSSVNNSGSTQTQIAVSAGSTYGGGNGMLTRYAAGNVQFGGNASTVSVSGNPVGSVNKIAASYQGVNASLAVNGGSVGTLGTLDFTGAGATTFIIGALTTGNLQQGNVTIRSIRYYTVRLPDATLQQITS